jgi:hypothetical protein
MKSPFRGGLLLLLLISTAWLLPTGLQAQNAEEGHEVVVRAGQLFDGTSETLRSEVTILIRDGTDRGGGFRERLGSLGAPRWSTSRSGRCSPGSSTCTPTSPRTPPTASPSPGSACIRARRALVGAKNARVTLLAGSPPSGTPAPASTPTSRSRNAIDDGSPRAAHLHGGEGDRDHRRPLRQRGLPPRLPPGDRDRGRDLQRRRRGPRRGPLPDQVRGRPHQDLRHRRRALGRAPRSDRPR